MFEEISQYTPDWGFLRDQFNELSTFLPPAGFDVYLTYTTMNGEVRSFTPQELAEKFVVDRKLSVTGYEEPLLLVHDVSIPHRARLLQPHEGVYGLEYLLISGFEVS